MSDLVQPGLSARLRARRDENLDVENPGFQSPDVEHLDVEHLDVEQSVRERYSAASRAVEPALCCPVQYDTRYLEVLPAELIERDYGCGDPSRWVQPGETVLDLGAGGGKICYIAAQIVGPQGRVIGVDMNDEMLALARRYEREIGDRIGWHNVEFHKGRIQDLAFDVAKLEARLAENPVRSVDDWNRTQTWIEQLRRSEPLVASDSIDVVLSNCVLNLVDQRDREQLFAEIYRVLRPGGRAVISDIVSDEPVPEAMRNDQQLWSGCISGAHHELEFLQRFEQAGFHGVEIVDRPAEPWMVVEGIEFRSVTVRAFKVPDAAGLDLHQAVIYRGPWNRVADDAGHVLERGVRTAVSDTMFQRFTSPPFAEQIIPVPPHAPVDPREAAPFDRQERVRDPRQTKGATRLTQLPSSDCCGGNC